jgi:hypothetical protein
MDDDGAVVVAADGSGWGDPFSSGDEKERSEGRGTRDEEKLNPDLKQKSLSSLWALWQNKFNQYRNHI